MRKYCQYSQEVVNIDIILEIKIIDYLHILHVQQVLGHRNIKDTLPYTQLVTLTDDKYVCKVARTPEEIQDLIENSFEYVCDQDDLKFFRKRK